jgi:Co/Zn/Cd efflux system component
VREHGYSLALSKEATMQLNPPTKMVFYLSLAFAAIGLIANFVSIPVLSGIALYLVLIGYILLILGNTLKGF